jgi:hypothetical protein
MEITEHTTKEELLANGYFTLEQFGKEMKKIIRQNAKEMEKKLAYKRTMEKTYYKDDEQFSFPRKITYV